MPISKVRKRDGRLEEFNPQKITNAILKALRATKQGNKKSAEKLSHQVVNELEKIYSGKIPSVENIQDIVEEILIKNKLVKTAKAYILYRQRRKEVREIKEFFGVKDDLKLGINAIKVLQRRYLARDENGNVIETPSQLFKRVAKAIASVEKQYGKSEKEIKKIEEQFYHMMANQEFMPNTPCLVNAGRPLGQLAACFVIPVEDSLESIFDALKLTAIIHKSGGGTGYNFSHLRPTGDVVKTTGGVASGPVSFMKIFDEATNQIKQGGVRRGANMGILNVDHPDILEFITVKSDGKTLSNFNISVAVTDEFMKAVEKNKEYQLINPRTGKVVKRLNASEVFDLIVYNAWKTGDPGLIFLDEINRKNPTAHLGKIESTNPCGEQPLHPYEECDLGSINVSKLVKNKKINWKRLKELVWLGVRFLDNIIDANKYPDKRIEETSKANRRIGLGVMGFAEFLIKLGIPYNSEKALKAAEKLMKFIEKEADEASQQLGKEKGNFPNFKGSLWDKKGYKYRRNATVTTIAPTGTISILAGCSSGIEPLFAVAFVRNVMEGTRLLEVTPTFEEIARKRKFYSSELLAKIAETGSVQNIPEVPEDVKKLFVTALDIEPEWHVRMQATFQRFTENAVSKTVNLREDATPEDVRKAYMLAWKLKCKGITVYRYGSKENQVLTIGSLEKELGEKHVIAESEFAGGCAGITCPH
ncbi:MAG: vitamin B12-dependent ribonucleotide reductase [Candidatus Aenigmatarchaeota archaeon]|nr:vitamin B12-dependent ribonucleotide reductase [Candidatus Aenigmarchaeota archaeon]